MGPSIVHYIAIGRNIFCRLNSLAELGGKQQAYAVKTFEVSYPVGTYLVSLTLSSTNILILKMPTFLKATMMLHATTSGNPGVPCNPCRVAETECVTDQDTDGRRRISFKRKIDALEEDRDLLIRLIETLRETGDGRAVGVLSLIRSNAPMEDIRLCLAQNQDRGISRREALAIARALPEARDAIKIESRVDTVMNLHRLSDNPLFDVPAKPWTSLTDDDALVSHLVSSYFTWSHQTLNWINRDIFIRAMKSGDTDSLFCSRLLVNTLLAEACFYTRWPEAFARVDDPQSRGLHLYYEAVRLLDKEEGRLSATTFQALGCIYVVACLSGKDRLGWQYLIRIADASREMMKNRDYMEARASPATKDMEICIDNALYGIFNTMV
ncbi:hypothetical protein N7488_006904 [Penicillium malachiteum]|nr:hypothetical protein N7488_006904 [Penicillium malachiteum]